jgi:SAM-dependent methyltransferase
MEPQTETAETTRPTYWEEIAGSRWGRYLSEQEWNAIGLATKLLAPGVVLEVGCEGGRWLTALRQLGWRVIGTDIVETHLALARSRLPDGRFIRVAGSASSLPAEDASVRLLLLIEVPEVAQATWFPPEASRVLEPGGLLVFAVHNRRSLRGLVYGLLRRWTAKRRQDLVFYEESYAAFRQRLRAAGLDAVCERGFAWMPFGRASNSPLVRPAAALERSLGLRRSPSLSPLVAGVFRRVDR